MEKQLNNYKIPFPQKVQSTVCVPTHVSPIVKIEELANKCFSHRTSLPVDADFSIRYNIKEEGLLKKQFGLISEDEFIAEANGKFFKVINAKFLDNGIVKNIERSMDITEFVNMGAKPEEIRFVVFATDINGKVIYLSNDYDKNILDWAEKTNSKKYKLRNEIIGENCIWDYMVGKEKQEMIEIFERAKQGFLIIREVNVSPEHFDELQCKNKNMTHVICSYSFENRIFMQDAVNISPLSHRMWESVVQEQLERKEVKYIKPRRIKRTKCIRKRRYGMIEPVPNLNRNIALLKRKVYEVENKKNARRAEKFMNSFSTIKIREIKINTNIFLNQLIYSHLLNFSIQRKEENKKSKTNQRLYIAETKTQIQKEQLKEFFGIYSFTKEKSIETKKTVLKLLNIKKRNNEEKKPKKPAFFSDGFSFNKINSNTVLIPNKSLNFSSIVSLLTTLNTNLLQTNFYFNTVHFSQFAKTMHFKTKVSSSSSSLFTLLNYIKLTVEPMPTLTLNKSRFIIDFPSFLKIITTQNLTKKTKARTQYFFQRDIIDYFFMLKILKGKNPINFSRLTSFALNFRLRRILTLKNRYAKLFSMLKIIALNNQIKRGIAYVS